MIRKLLTAPHLLVVALFATLAFAGTARAFPTPERTGWVTDEAGVLDDATEAVIADRLQRLKDETGIEIVVVTLRNLQGLSIETWGDLLGETWGVGRGAGKDNGGLLIVAPSARKVRIAVGYGLGKSIPDSTAQMIIDQQIIPRFRSGDLAGGVVAGAKAMSVYAEMGSPERALKVESDPDFAPKPKITLTPITISVVVMIACVVVLLILHGAHHIAVAVSSPARVRDDDDRVPAAPPTVNPSSSATTKKEEFGNSIAGIWLTNMQNNAGSRSSSSRPSSGSLFGGSSRSSSGLFGSSSSSSSGGLFGGISRSSSSGSRRSFGGGASGSW